jgi:hypothetical protein
MKNKYNFNLFIYFSFQLVLAINNFLFQLFFNEKNNESDQIWINIKVQ